ncbi:MAG: alanine--tRNA ligase [Deltaproteobacteria bacterium RIFCSPHIGHO2_02_FULL_44_16]|nr:MAG: alanine--tRNA ligase [Deltaproteobacteria bacterium RIFCSPHIGHO2_02_FULL_44_16]
MKSSDLRESFLKFFEKNGHTRVPSSSLVPANDPTLFFTNAGMVQFKEVFLGEEKRPYHRACSSQKCMRVSGKHNDLENVGFTPRHHTFFEMLGNFSFGDYFKEGAIALSWEYLTKTLALDSKKLYVTVFRDDDEAEKLWKKFVPSDHIFRFDEKDNFWAMGETGPCGPCSEIHWDFGKGLVTKEDIASDRFMEIWNLVFMQFNRSQEGELTRLAAPSIDTGMGLERLACVVQGKKSNWETDLFQPLIARGEELSGHRENESDDIRIALRVIADHLRAMTFLIADGVTPSNEGRGYVLRRIMRRAIRYGKRLGMNEPFLSRMHTVVVQEMGKAYPELRKHYPFIGMVIGAEEERFYETLERGLGLITETIETLKKSGKKVIPGEVIFKLYDTYGFPKDLTELIAAEEGVQIDHKTFDVCMEEQRTRARKSWKGSGEERIADVWKTISARVGNTDFVGYEKDEVTSSVVALVVDGKEVDEASEGAEVSFVTAATPFYGEGGGQVGDTGLVTSKNIECQILDTIKPFPNFHVHKAKILKGKLHYGTSLHLKIDQKRRAAIRKNHTATHLLHKALRTVLGEHVKQAGSLVDDHHLRFDFSHFQKLTDEEMKKIETMINEAIKKNIPVTTHVLSYDEAIKRGAIAFFGEKYGSVVRLVEVDNFSRELCGGTHVVSTGEIGEAQIMTESSVAAGVRRMELVTGEAVKTWQEKRAQLHQEEAARLKQKEAQKDQAKQKQQGALQQYADLAMNAVELGGIKILVQEVNLPDIESLRLLAEQQRDKLVSGVVVLGTIVEEKVSLLVVVSKDLTDRVKAGDIIREIAPLVGGKGGGRPEMAQGGGPDTAKLPEALTRSLEYVRNAFS